MISNSILNITDNIIQVFALDSVHPDLIFVHPDIIFVFLTKNFRAFEQEFSCISIRIFVSLSKNFRAFKQEFPCL